MLQPEPTRSASEHPGVQVEAFSETLDAVSGAALEHGVQALHLASVRGAEPPEHSGRVTESKLSSKTVPVYASQAYGIRIAWRLKRETVHTHRSAPPFPYK